MGGSTWIQDKTELYEGELIVFKRANSPNWYMRVYVTQEQKHYQKSLRTQNQLDAIEKAKQEYKIIQRKVAKDEKVFTISISDAIEGYFSLEKTRLRRGLIKEDWLNKKHQYIKNTFAHHFGLETKVNAISDKQIEEFIDIRLKRCKKKQTIQQEIVIIKHFYKTYLIKNGFVFKIPEFPEFKITKKDLSRRTDTFTKDEIEKLMRFMIREWCFRSNDERYNLISRTRISIKQYGKIENKEKKLNQMEWDLELHRRNLLLYAIMLSALTGIRTPGELLNLRWCDIEYKQKKIQNRNSMIQPMGILPGGEFIDIDYHKSSGFYNINKIIDEWMCNDKGEMDISIINIVDGKTGSRSIPCLLAGLFHQIEDYFAFMGYSRGENPDAPIFMELFGRRKFQPIDKYVFNRMWRELMRDAGLERIKFTPYHLRHYFITQRIRAGTPIPQLAKICGNSPNIIYSTYEHIILEDDMDVLYKTV